MINRDGISDRRSGQDLHQKSAEIADSAFVQSLKNKPAAIQPHPGEAP